MARSKLEPLITQSLLDRLTQTEDWPTTRHASLRLYREGIKRDVEWLLNTRRPHPTGLERFPLACNSVMNYGLPDLTQFPGAANSPDDLLIAILNTLRIYEPRIGNPHVTLLQTDTLARSLRFHIQGRLQLETNEEEISFDTVLEVSSGEYEVR